MIAVAVERLTVSLPEGQRIVHNLSFAIGEGEVVAIVGESGSGKTTTITALVRALRPPAFVADGRIRLLGRELAELSDEDLRAILAREVGFVVSNPQSNLNPLARAGQQVADRYRVAFGSKKSEALRQAEDMLSSVGIQDAERWARAYPHELSGGMAQRVVIARALAPAPRLLIADEPTSGLDVTIQRQILDLIASQVAARQMAMILVTHDLGVAARYCDRLLAMYEGEIVEDAPADAFFAGPGHRYSRALLEASRGDDVDLQAEQFGNGTQQL